MGNVFYLCECFGCMVCYLCRVCPYERLNVVLEKAVLDSVWDYELLLNSSDNESFDPYLTSTVPVHEC
jgi:hypothetical protein